jgi:hypothetical protein
MNIIFSDKMKSYPQLGLTVSCSVESIAQV